MGWRGLPGRRWVCRMGRQDHIGDHKRWSGADVEGHLCGGGGVRLLVWAGVWDGGTPVLGWF